MADILLILAEDSVERLMPVDRRKSRLSLMVQKLRSTFPDVRTLVEDAEQRQLKDAGVKKWLVAVKDVCYEAIDVFEELGILQAKLQKQKNAYLPSFSLSFSNPVRQLTILDYTARKIGNLIEKIDLVRKDESRLALSRKSIEGSSQLESFNHSRLTVEDILVQTAALADEDVMFGRDRDKRTLMSMLFSESSEKLGIYYLTVVGTGGIGKTTLVQSVYKSSKVKKHFDLQAWISVMGVFDMLGIVNDITESVTGETSSGDQVESEVLIQRFRQTIAGKTCLFVLDDVHNENISEWESLQHVFKFGAPGSVILITTRSLEVSRAARSAQVMLLNALNYDDSWLMLKHLAFGTSMDVKELETTFREVAREFIIKCQGVPLALKAVGGILCTKTSVEDWQAVLQEFEKFSDNWASLSSTLMFCYCYLPPYLRQCLLYCSIFPKNQSIDVDKLIRLWMAQNILVSGIDEMEREGRRCFEELLRRSLFQKLRRDDNGNLVCNMNGLLTDLIRYLAQNECCIMHIDQNRNVKMDLSFHKGRHWTMNIAAQASFPISISSSEKVHTLMIISEYPFVDPVALSNLLCHSRRLRALDLSHCLIKELPVKIGKLLHLRYLDLSFNCDLKELPEALCNLSLLQTLNLNGCDNLRKLPNGIEKLIHLRHLEILWTKSLSYLPKGIRSLTSLRTLNRFFGNGDVNNKACNLEDLGKLRQLEGFISIDGLGGATDEVLAKKANFQEKEGLNSVDLWFSGVGPVWKDHRVLEILEPHPNLKCLGIFYYREKSFPDWIAGLKQLRHLMLSDCGGCESLPPLGKLPLLESLEIRNMVKVKKIGSQFLGIETTHSDGGNVVFPELKELRFHNLINWEEWDEITKSGRNVYIMPKLSSLSIVKCSKILAVPDYIERKEGLNCHFAECPLLKEEKNEEN